MSRKSWKSYIIPFIFIAVFLFAVGITAQQQHVVSDSPAQLSPLSDSDFVIAGADPELKVGEAGLGDVSLQFPGGKMLGRSEVYKPASGDVLFTFTRKTNILNKIDITGPVMATSRGVAVGDSFDKAAGIYGDGFKRSYYRNDPATFDAVYGLENCIVFHVENNKVTKIVIMHEV